MGVSILSLIEVIYYITLRLGCKLWKKRANKIQDSNHKKSKIIDSTPDVVIEP